MIENGEEKLIWLKTNKISDKRRKRAVSHENGLVYVVEVEDG